MLLWGGNNRVCILRRVDDRDADMNEIYLGLRLYFVLECTISKWWK